MINIENSKTEIVDNSEVIKKYFTELSEVQINRFDRLKSLYSCWNERINVISRKDITNLYIKHVLHSLAIAKTVSFLPDAQILDIGTGGGFPAIPLAILFPDARFTAIDSTGKKIKVVENISQALNLNNIEAKQERAENIRQTFDFVVGRAVTNLPDFTGLGINKIKQQTTPATPTNGIICLKGGDL
ncbi:MAG: 16S rRNA (guanine(527)-N(7))-methyltransferase RsmG, partial [Prevotellaceae bacterium]|nr:16S rRNA (guanine(527)-N(7))-methyltransferase RsmG [Prevotellaceae bacterium]